MKLNTLVLSLSMLFFGFSFQNKTNNSEQNTVKETLNIKTKKPVFSFTLNGHLSEAMSLETLQQLKSDVVLYKNQTPAEGYEVQSFVVILVSKNGDTDVHTHKGNMLKEDVLTSIKQLKAGDRILLDQVKVKTPEEDTRNIAPKIYKVVEK